MAESFIPTQEGLALTFMQTFAAGIATSPATYQLSSIDSAAISAAVDLFAAKYAIALDPATRTSVSVAQKDDARNSAEALVRQYAINIKFNAGISDPAKIAIGVRPVNHSRTPITVPASSPLMNVLAATPGSHTLRYADTMTPDSAAKPFGAASIQIFRTIGPEPTTDDGAALFYGAFTKNPIGVAFDAADDGKVATYYARWADRKGQVGPWSLPVSMRIAA